jgi:uncharacterized protein (TIGR02246 family)
MKQSNARFATSLVKTTPSPVAQLLRRDFWHWKGVIKMVGAPANIRRFKVSPKSWIVFSVAAVFLLLVAFVAVRQFPDVPIVHEAKETVFDDIPKEATAGPASQPQGQLADKSSAPETAAKNFVQAWNRGSAENIAGLFAPDAVLIMPTGSTIRSRAEIEKTISHHRSGVLKESTLTNTVDDVSQPDDDSAVLKGRYQLEGIKVLGISTTSTGSYELRQTKQNGRWLIAKAEVTGK